MLVGANADVIDPGDLGHLPQTVDLGVDPNAEATRQVAMVAISTISS
jgi:hypothetical protein